MKNLRGEITNVIDGSAYVNIPDYGDVEYGPLEILNDIALVAGDRVIVAQVSRSKEDLVVMGKVRGTDG